MTTTFGIMTSRSGMKSTSKGEKSKPVTARNFHYWICQSTCIV